MYDKSKKYIHLLHSRINREVCPNIGYRTYYSLVLTVGLSSLHLRAPIKGWTPPELQIWSRVTLAWLLSPGATVSSSSPLSLSDESASSSFCYTSQSSCHYEKEEIYIVLRETQFPSRVTRMHRLVSVFETSNSALVCHSLKKPTGSQWHILTLICGPSLVNGCGDRCMVGTKFLTSWMQNNNLFWHY